jgi:ketosteroid isomerase-like protein
MRRSAIAVFLVFVAASPVLGQSMTDKIRSLRDQSNAAIARHDVDGVLSFLDVEYQITTGSGTLSQGRAGERDAWTVEFARASDLVYVRTPASIEVSSSGGRAAETGTWTGSWSTRTGLRKSGGRYAAYWRLVDGNWRIRSELFVTLTCEGPGCS